MTRRRHWAVLCAAAGLLASCSSGVTQPPPAHALMTPADLLALPVRDPDYRITYGEAPSQYGELRVPAGDGPHPVVVLVHGGCWKQAYADARSIGAMGDALRDLGVATWSIEYRRLPEPGSGWPGTYLDIANSVDHLRVIAAEHHLDLNRAIAVGHSAGGHLALWAAARSRLLPDSALFIANPLPLRGAVNLAGRMNMAEGIAGYEAVCNDPVVHDLLGGAPADVPERYAQASPSSLLPLGVPQVLIWGELEDQVPAPLARAYVKAAAEAGESVRLITVSDIGHFETASPLSSAWPTVRAAILSLLNDEELPADGSP